MQLRLEPQTGLRIDLRRVALIGGGLAGLVFGVLFFTGSLFSAENTFANSVSVNAATTVQTSNNPFGSLSSGDTIFLYGVFNVNADYDDHEDNTITIIVDGSNAVLRVFQNRELILGDESSIVLLNGGKVEATGNCAESAKIIIGGEEIANCPGSNGTLSFAQINSYGGINIGELPVSWLESSAEIKTRNEVEIKWSTASEENNSHFDVEFSIDGENWISAGTVYSASDNGFSNEILEYKYTHYIYEVANLVYYRIKQTDHDGKFDYSGILTAEFNTKTPVAINTLGNNTIKVNVEYNRHTSGKI